MSNIFGPKGTDKAIASTGKGLRSASRKPEERRAAVPAPKLLKQRISRRKAVKDPDNDEVIDADIPDTIVAASNVDAVPEAKNDNENSITDALEKLDLAPATVEPKTKPKKSPSKISSTTTHTRRYTFRGRVPSSLDKTENIAKADQGTIRKKPGQLPASRSISDGGLGDPGSNISGIRSKKQQPLPAIGPEEAKKLPTYLDKPGNRPGLRSHSRHAVVNPGEEKESSITTKQKNPLAGKASDSTRPKRRVPSEHGHQSGTKKPWFERLSTPRKAAEKATISPVENLGTKRASNLVSGKAAKHSIGLARPTRSGARRVFNDPPVHAEEPEAVDDSFEHITDEYEA